MSFLQRLSSFSSNVPTPIKSNQKKYDDIVIWQNIKQYHHLPVNKRGLIDQFTITTKDLYKF